MDTPFTNPGPDTGLWQKRLEELVEKHMETDPVHDLGHLRRVWRMAQRLAASEEGPVDMLVLEAASYLHDLVNLPKNDPRSAQASMLSAERARELLTGIGFPQEKLDAVAHAIAAHSFSAGIPPETIEAAIVQDADRLDALGAVGLARLFQTSGQIGRAMFDLDDPFCRARTPDERRFAIDHVYTKLRRIPPQMQTVLGSRLARERLGVIDAYLAELEAETGI